MTVAVPGPIPKSTGQFGLSVRRETAMGEYCLHIPVTRTQRDFCCRRPGIGINRQPARVLSRLAIMYASRETLLSTQHRQ
ncbi:MAG: hypothetical protein U5L02_06530 [Rheinheimera sp.]|nr:hypothetical protein [Rheinheimera sp.]